ncbi:MAG: hypothetical protein ABW110_13620 [Steroidobacteraceae bacterium]
MDRKYIDDNHVVARYLADQLPDGEREAFEAYYLEHPEIVREMEVTARFKDALATLRDQGELSQLIQSRPPLQTGMWLAAAAVIGVVAIGATYLIRTTSLRPSMVARVDSLNLPVGITVRVERTRGSADIEFPLPAAGTAIALQVAPEFEARPAIYRVALARELEDELRPVTELNHISANDGLVSVYIDRSVLEPGLYRLSLQGAEGTDATTKRSVFRIRIR